MFALYVYQLFAILCYLYSVYIGLVVLLLTLGTLYDFISTLRHNQRSSLKQTDADTLENGHVSTIELPNSKDNELPQETSSAANKPGDMHHYEKYILTMISGTCLKTGIMFHKYDAV